MIYLLKKTHSLRETWEVPDQVPPKANLTSKQSIGWLSLFVTLTSHFSAIPVVFKLLPEFVNNGVDEYMLGGLRSSGGSSSSRRGSRDDLVTHFLVTVLLEFRGRGYASCAVPALGGSREGRIEHAGQLVFLGLSGEEGRTRGGEAWREGGVWAGIDHVLTLLLVLFLCVMLLYLGFGSVPVTYVYGIRSCVSGLLTGGL